MGSGKTKAAIRHMKETDEKFIYLTPYLTEVKRIIKECDKKNFITPSDEGYSKLNELHNLLGEGRNISSTHALFAYYTDITIDLIRSHDYTLIMDEVFKVLDPVSISEPDLQMLFDTKKCCMDEDGEHIKWLDDNYHGEHLDIMLKAKTHNLIYYKNMMMFWKFPTNIFKAFKDVYVLTYLFDAQLQKYYYDVSNVVYTKIGIERSGDDYKFGEITPIPESARKLKDRIHITDYEKINRIGDSEFALSASWYNRAFKVKNKPLIVQIKNNVCNYLLNIVQSNSKSRMWTTFKRFEKHITGAGYGMSFVSCNARATNEHVNRNTLAYLINIYFNPVLKNYFVDHGVHVKEDEYALSELIQWIWRSAIRDGKEIWLYIPSKRMRDLLTNWLDELSKTK